VQLRHCDTRNLELMLHTLTEKFSP